MSVFNIEMIPIVLDNQKSIRDETAPLKIPLLSNGQIEEMMMIPLLYLQSLSKST